ncbi:hypothetical protein MTBLM1_60091 [Rhodospirillaceae bacterium LM-1]|nr:hypothetical protein MTBLM1_60091 [Rhodospirillaceae bacterium LM-1]
MGNAGNRRHQPLEFRRRRQHQTLATLGGQGQKTGELNHVAETLFGQHQKRSIQRLTIPGQLRGWVPSRPGKTSPTPFVEREALFLLSQQQEQMRQIVSGDPLIRVERQRPLQRLAGLRIIAILETTDAQGRKQVRVAGMFGGQFIKKDGGLFVPPFFPKGMGRIKTILIGCTSRHMSLASMHWWVMRGSNPRPSRCKRDALPLS